MKSRALAIHGTLALAAVAAAYVAWQHPRSPQREKDIVIIDGRPEALQAVQYVDDDNDVTVQRHGSDIQVLVAAAASPGAPPRVFPPTFAARSLFEAMAPLVGQRSLGTLDAEHLKAFGLTEHPATLSLRYGGAEHVLKIGGATPAGSSTYVQSASGDVHLVRSAVFSELRGGANGLAERTLIPLVRDRIEKVLVHHSGRERQLVQRFREDPTRAYWADPAEPNKKLVQAGTWIERLLRTRMVDFASARPQGAPALSIDFFGDGRTLGQLSLWAPSGSSATAISSAFGEPLSLAKASAETILQDGDAALGEAPR
jgi:hypothetical protein